MESHFSANNCWVSLDENKKETEVKEDKKDAQISKEIPNEEPEPKQNLF